jgi:hypothetical protein
VVPVAVNVPVAVVPVPKHDDEVVKLRLLTLTAPLLFCESVAVKVKAVAPSVLVRVAVQLPFIVLFEPPPQAINIIATVHRIERMKCLILPSGKTTKQMRNLRRWVVTLS